jgi:hypothetical protein
MHALSVKSTVALSVPITGSLPAYSGTTNYSVSVGEGSSLSLTAPATTSGAEFSNWIVCNSVSGVGNRTCNVNMTSSKTVTANYIDLFNYSLSSPDTTYVTKTSSTAHTQNAVIKTHLAGDRKPVTLAVTAGLSAGVSVSGISNQTCDVTCTSTITLAVAPTTPIGTYLITVTGTPLNKQTTFNLEVRGNPISTACSASPTSALLGEVVTWTAAISGGTPPFTYTWSGTSIPTNPVPNTNPFSISYSTIGQKTAAITATDADGLPSTCPPATVQIKFDPRFQEF